MNSRQNLFFWSFGLGTCYRTRIRISWLYPFLLLVLCWKLGVQLGGAIGGILFLSTLLHEFGHIIAARAMDGTGEEILIWPLGGLAFVDAPSSTRAQIVTAAGGPIVNFFLCAMTLPFVAVSREYASAAFNPLVLPMSSEQFGVDLVGDLLVLTFALNWMLLLVNLVPAYPLDGGRIVRSILVGHLGGMQAAEYSIRVAYFSALLLALVALALDHTLLLGLAFMLTLLAMQESLHMQAGESYEDSFMGYDFSQGYTSLERTETKRAEPRPGFITRWRERRRADKRRRLELEQQEAATKLDLLLAKVHEQGLDSLTEAEKRQLRNASQRYRSKDSGSP